MRPLVSAALVAALLLAPGASARPKGKMFEIKDPPSTAHAWLEAALAEKPGAARDANLFSMEARLREKGEELTDPDAVDALVATTFEKIFDDMAGPTDVWVWEGETGARGDVLVREKVLLFPGRTSTGFSKELTVQPKGKRIDRGYLNSKLTVKVAVAKSDADWFAWTDAKGWGAAVHPVLVNDNVARVVVQLFSPGKKDSPGPRHERPVWVAYFKRAKADAPFELALFEPAMGLDQREQEANVISLTVKNRPTEAHKKLILALRMEDLRYLNPARPLFSNREAEWFALKGLTECPVDAKTVAWLEPWRTAEHPLQRAAAVLKLDDLHAPVKPAELLWVYANVKLVPVQLVAQAKLEKALEAQDLMDAADREAVQKASGSDDVRGVKDVARAKGGTAPGLYQKGEKGWALVTPKK